MRIVKQTTILILMALAILVSADRIWAQTITYVDKDAAGAADGTSWSSAFPKLQDALDCVNTAACPNEIWVAAGVYLPDEGATVTPDDATESFYLVNGAALYGGFDGVGAGGVGGTQETLLDERDYDLNKTILSGDLQRDDIDVNGDGIITLASHIVGTNSQHVVYVDALNRGAFSGSTIIDGFYITAGAGGVIGGGGLLCNGTATASCDPALTHLIFRGNKADNGSGGGIFASYSNAVLTDVTITGGDATYFGGALHAYESDLTIVDSKFKNNSAETGGGLSFVDSEPTIDGTNIEGNSAELHGGGIHADNSSPHLSNVTFIANSASAWGGGMHHFNGEPTFLNTGFFGNSGSDGGAVFSEINTTGTLAISFTNPIFSGNTAVTNGGALSAVILGGIVTVNMDIVNASFNRDSAGLAGGSIYIEGPLLTIDNSILWGSTDGIGLNGMHVESGTITMSYSDLQGLGGTGVTTGLGGLFVNAGNNPVVFPFFVDFDGADNVLGTDDDDLHLKVTSPVIDTGSNTLAIVTVDYDNHARKASTPPVKRRVDRGALEYCSALTIPPCF